MTKSAKIQGPKDLVFLVHGDFESSLYSPCQAWAWHLVGVPQNVRWIRRKSDSYGMKAHSVGQRDYALGGKQCMKCLSH